jgi:hypothetical protein
MTMPWDAIKPILNDVGSLTFVKCFVYIIIDRKEKVIMFIMRFYKKLAK